MTDQQDQSLEADQLFRYLEGMALSITAPVVQEALSLEITRDCLTDSQFELLADSAAPPPLVRALIRIIAAAWLRSKWDELMAEYPDTIATLCDLRLCKPEIKIEEFPNVEELRQSYRNLLQLMKKLTDVQRLEQLEIRRLLASQNHPEVFDDPSLVDLGSVHKVLLGNPFTPEAIARHSIEQLETLLEQLISRAQKLETLTSIEINREARDFLAAHPKFLEASSDHRIPSLLSGLSTEPTLAQTRVFRDTLQLVKEAATRWEGQMGGLEHGPQPFRDWVASGEQLEVPAAA